MDYIYIVTVVEFDDDNVVKLIQTKPFRNEEDAQEYTDSFMLKYNNYKIKEVNDAKIELADSDNNKRVVVKMFESELN